MIDTPHHHQQTTVLRIYASFRLLLGFSLIMLFLFAGKFTLLGNELPSLYTLVNSVFLGYGFIMLVRHLLQRSETPETQVFFEYFFDIGCLMLMSYSSSRLDSGLPMLLIVTVSAASLTLSARLALSIASLASISAIAETTAKVLYNDANPQSFVLAGSLGTAYFTSAMVIRYLSSRIAKTQSLADRQSIAVRKLSQINQQIVQRMQTGILVMNRRGDIRLLNEAAAELLNLPYPAPGEGLQAPPQITALLGSRRQRSSTLSMKNAPGDLHINWTRLQQQDGEEFLLYLENISKISQRAQNLKLASLGRFTASIAHEIRNPLAAISHAAQLLDESDDLTQIDQRFITIIKNQTARMNDIIKNILELSRGRPPEPEEFFLRDWLQNFIGDWQSNQQDQAQFSLDWDSDSALPVNVDPSQLRQIIANITENGIRFGQAQTGLAEIRYHISQHPISGATLLEISDNGPGIAAEDEDKIFEPFFTTQTQGNGLGLYLCRELCLANQIQISYHRNQQGGSCFRLLFAHPDRESFSDWP